jgi:hypothetical protein
MLSSKLYAFHELCSLLSITVVRGISCWGEYATQKILFLSFSLNLWSHISFFAHLSANYNNTSVL